MNTLRIATIGLLAVSLAIPSAVFAQEPSPEHREGALRVAGEITGVVPGQGTFSLNTRQGRELEFQTNDQTKFRSPDGAIEDIHDLKKGMKAMVAASEQPDGTLIASMVAAGNPEDLPEHLRVAGEIQALDPGNQSLAVKTREGGTQVFKAGDRTRYRGDGIEGFEDLAIGMQVLVAAIPQESGLPIALLIAAREPRDRPEINRLGGEITDVVPGQGTFTLMDREGAEFQLSTDERTRFHSRDGSIEDIHDLKQGMFAMVGAIQQEGGELLALVVAAGDPEDRPELDVKAAGRIIAKGSSSFTLRTRAGDEISFHVGEKTHYAGVSSYAELEEGMGAAVGAIETESGLFALFVGARSPEGRPGRPPEGPPENRPDRPGPGEGQEQDVSA